MSRRWMLWTMATLAAIGEAGCGTCPCSRRTATEAATAAETTMTIRIASYNVYELSREKLDRVDAEGRGTDEQLRAAAEVVQGARPDVLVLNEIDFDEGRENAELFLARYLAVPQGSQEAISYPYVVFEPVNTGVPTGLDLDDDGEIAGDPEDAFGFGHYPGQYGMALYSRFPVDHDALRTFRLLRWSAVPGNLMPDGTGGKPAWYEPGEAAILRLSSKSHWDVPVAVGGTTLHVLASHPTPPVFDGEEDRNGRRNFDEVRLWADYLTGGDAAAWIVDDAGRRGGLPAGAPFVVVGDLNADPASGEAIYGRPSIRQLLDHPRVQDPTPTSEGARLAEADGYAGDPATRTAEFGRADYVLPSRDLRVVAAGVDWPPPADPRHDLVARAGDHHLVWVDVTIPQR